MIRRLIASLMVSASIFVGALPFMRFPELKLKDDFVPASFDAYEVTLADGATVNMMLSGDRVIFDSSENRSFDITLTKCKSLRVVRNFTGAGGLFDIEFASSMNEGELYYITLSYEAFGRTITNGNNIIFRDGDELYFWKTSNYKYNVGTCSELMTDKLSLQECLEPQNDVECDDPVLIGYSERICDGAEDDWEKVYRIYTYIAHGMAYDSVESDASSGTYQDSAVDVLRDGKSICEGFANTFTALCRAQGIPAAVEFGMGFSDYEEMTERDVSKEKYADHAWAAVYLGGKWHFVDPTYDMSKTYYGDGNIESGQDLMLYYLLPLESFSNDHMILDADTRHGIPSSGSCGDHATYEITRDGVCTISGYGKIKMPEGVNGFNKVVFADDCKVDTIGKHCFDDCDLITSVILPDSVRVIEGFAFNTCEDLEYVYIPEGCAQIGEQAFCYCDELSYVRIPDSVTWIGPWAFDDCPRLYISVSSEHSDFAKRYDTKPMYIETR